MKDLLPFMIEIINYFVLIKNLELRTPSFSLIIL